MGLEQYIEKLLYQYDCVIVPEFGGFLCHQINSSFDPVKYTFRPPRKVVSFNINLSTNDGLLANFISTQEDISYQEAIIFIKRCVREWNLQLQSYHELDLNGLGKMYIQGKKHLEFKPDYQINFLVESYGLSQVQAHYINTNKQTTSPKTLYRPLKHVAILGIPFLLGGLVFYTLFKQPASSINQSLSGVFIDGKELFYATDKTSPKETVILKSSPKKESLISSEPREESYDLIVGAYHNMDAAVQLQNVLNEKGYIKSKIIQAQGRTILVSISAFSTEAEAFDERKKIEAEFPNAWPRHRKN